MWQHVLPFYIFIAFYFKEAINSSVCDDEKLRLAIRTCIPDAKSCINKTLLNPIAVTTTIAEIKPKIKTTISTTAVTSQRTLTGTTVITLNE